jgi:uncharacterized protein (UPF0332 family)
MIQGLLTDSLRSSKNIEKEPDDFLDRVLGQGVFNAESLSRAVDAVYKNIFYSFSKDLILDDVEKRKLAHVSRLLRIDDERSGSLDYDVGLAIYRKRFRESLSDGELSDSEQEDLNSIAKAFGLQKRHIKKTISRYALAHYSLVLADSLKDGILSSEEMAELENIDRRFGLTSKDLSTISVPDKKEILRAALATIKSRGKIEEEDSDGLNSCQ